MAPFENDNSVENIAYFSFIVDIAPAFNVPLRDDDPEDRLFYFAQEIQQKLQADIRAQVARTLGEEFTVDDFHIERGSVIITFSVAAVAFFTSPLGQILLDFSRYDALIKSLTLLRTQISSVIGRLFGGFQAPLRMHSTWQPSMKLNAAMHAPSAPTEPQRPDISRILIAYLIFSHASLLAVLLWLVVKHLK